MGGCKSLLRMTIGFGRWSLAFRWHTRLFFLFFSLLLLPPAQLESLNQPLIGAFRKKYGLEILRKEKKSCRLIKSISVTTNLIKHTWLVDSVLGIGRRISEGSLIFPG